MIVWNEDFIPEESRTAFQSWLEWRLRQAREEASGACPCLHTTPCDPRCTCANGLSSRGCDRCCSYGSMAQQKAMAEHLATATTRAREAALEEAAQRVEEEIAGKQLAYLLADAAAAIRALKSQPPKGAL